MVRPDYPLSPATCLRWRGHKSTTFRHQNRHVMGSEDFAYYRRLCPTTYFFLGAGNKEKGYVYPNHSPHFDFDEEALPVGVQVFLNILGKLMKEL